MTRFVGPEGQEDMPYLLTPGPVTTSRGVKFAMLADWGARDGEFAKLVKSINGSLKSIGGCDESFDCVLMQGSGFSGIEAALGTFTPSKRKKTLIVANGANGQGAIQIMQRIGRSHVVLDSDELKAINPGDVAKALDADRNITHVWVVHCETSSGIVNPIAEIAQEVKSRGRIMMLDALASFGALPLHMGDGKIDVLVSCPDKCIESVPGFSFVLAKCNLLEAAKDECHSLALDLHAQWDYFKETGRFRFTPPTHSLMAAHAALRELEAEGGVAGRANRYRQTADAVVTRIKALGFSALLPDMDRGPIVQSILAPGDKHYDFKVFAEKLRARGFVIYPGEIPLRDSFLIGTIGKVNEKLMLQLMVSIEDVMNEMGVRNFAPTGN